MAEDWSREEVEATVASYFQMLAMELAGTQINKTAHRRALLPLLRGRSDDAVQFKHANISAVLAELDKPFVDGHKPYPNYQQLLAEVVVEQLAASPTLLALMEHAALATAAKPEGIDYSGVVADPPSAPRARGAADSRHLPRPPILGKNYLEMEQRNRSLGRSGEEFVVDFERFRLWRSGKGHLSDRVEHVAVTQGDGLGYDVLSYDESGRDRWIEVKTTRRAKETAFFVTPKEEEVSTTEDASYYLYRVFTFDRPKLYMVDGPLRNHFTLDPSQFKARPR